MRKTIFLFSALIWTGIILVLCLIQSTDMPVINIMYLDKVIHATFHFIFTTLWFLYFRKRLINTSNFRLLTIALIGSFLFGISIELMQQYFTTTRQADIFDVLANLAGATLAVITIVLLNNRNKFIDKI